MKRKAVKMKVTVIAIRHDMDIIIYTPEDLTVSELGKIHYALYDAVNRTHKGGRRLYGDVG